MIDDIKQNTFDSNFEQKADENIGYVLPSDHQICTLYAKGLKSIGFWITYVVIHKPIIHIKFDKNFILFQKQRYFE